jgi:hypothetical protein
MLGMSRARLIVVSLLTSACHTWNTVPIAPNSSGPLPRHSTVVLMDGRRVQVEDGRTTRDSLIGIRLSGAHFAVPRDSVYFVETRKVSVIRSVGAGAGGLLATASVLLIVGIMLVLNDMP